MSGNSTPQPGRTTEARPDPAAADSTTASNRAESSEEVDTPRNVTPEAQRALAEAAERRRAMAQNKTDAPREVGGRDGPDPVRYGDWEKGGIASDF